MRVAVVVPWRPTPGREPAFNAVRRWWATQFPDAQFIPVDTPHEQFNVSAARNHGVRLAAGADVVVVCDADTIPDPDGIREAVAQARDGNIHVPYRAFAYLSRSESRRAIQTGVWPAKTDGRWASGGVWVCSPAAWWAAGGMDERFRVWGGEDDAFWAAAQTLVGIVPHDGVGVGMWHPGGHRFAGRHYELNGQLLARYNAAEGDPAAMRALVSETDTTTTYLVLCAGDGSRWKGAGPKQLAVLCGEPLLHRIVRQVRGLDPAATVKVVTRSRDPRFDVDGADQVVVDVDPTADGADKATSSREHWNASGRTVLLLGDVFYTDLAMRRIVDHYHRDWVMFGRPGPSKITGKKWGEQFAMVFWPEQHERIISLSAQLADTVRAGKALDDGRLSQLFMLLDGGQLRRWTRPNSDHYQAVCDWTDDFDVVEDWHVWCLRYAEAKRRGEPVP